MNPITDGRGISMGEQIARYMIALRIGPDLRMPRLPR